MANEDVGSLQATLELDTKNFEQGVTKATKKLDTLSSSFQKSQKSIDKSLASIDKGVTNLSNVLTKQIGNQVKTLNTSMISLKNTYNGNSRQIINAIRSMQTSVVGELQKMGKAFVSLEQSSKKDLSTGLKSLQKVSSGSSKSVINDLKNIQKEAEKTRNSLNSASTNKSLKVSAPKTKYLSVDTVNTGMASSMQSVASTSKTVDVNVTSIGTALQKASFNLFLMEQSFMQVANIVDFLISPGLEFAKSMETNRVGMAGILSSMVEVKGQQLEWNSALQLSSDIIKDLNVEAVKTAATSEELVSTFRALLGPGLGAGMSIDEIKELTVVGVNAVKSMGLDGRQLVQELRDLVQGGIQPASSTLATALGLKDADIKAAQQSSEGLFKFLMKRLQGFSQATEETGNTLAGMLDQVGEGYTLATSEALKPIIQEYKNVLVQLRGVMFTDDLGGIDPKFLDIMQSIGEHVVNLWKGLQNVYNILSPVIIPAFELLGSVLAAIADNVDRLILAFGAWTIYKNIEEVYQLNTAMGKSQEAQTLLGQASEKVSSIFSASSRKIQASIDAEKQAAINATQTVLQQYNAERAQRVQDLTIIRTVKELNRKAEKTENEETRAELLELAKDIKNLKRDYEVLGLSAEQAGKLQYEAAQMARKGKIKVAQDIIAEADAHLELSNSLNNNAQKYALLGEKIGKVSGAIGGISVAIGTLNSSLGDSDSEFTQVIDRVTTLVTSLAIAGGAIATIIEKWAEHKAAIMAARAALETFMIPFSMMASIAIGIAGAVGTLTAAIYAMAEGLDQAEISMRYFGTRAERDKEIIQKNYDTVGIKNAMVDVQKQAYDPDWEIRGGKSAVAPVSTKDVKKKDFGNVGEEAGAKGTDTAAAKRAKAAYKALEAELKVFQTQMKEQQAKLDNSYKNDLVSTQNYVEAKASIQKSLIDEEIKNLEARKKIAQENNQESDVQKFDNDIANLREKSLVAEADAVRELQSEYKKLQDRLDAINSKYEDVVGTSEEAFKTNLIKEFSADYARLLAEVTTANERLKHAVENGSDADKNAWTARKQALDGTIEKLNTIIQMRKLEYDAVQSQAEIERINLEIEEQYINSRTSENRLSKTSLQAEAELFDYRKEHMNEYIDQYTDLIAKYEKMAQIASEQGDLQTANNFKAQALEAKQALLDLTDAVPPFQKIMKEQVIDSLSDAFQSIAWGEKSIKEAFQDLGKSILQTWTKRIFDEISTSITDNLFSALLPNNEKPGNMSKQVDTIVTQKVNSDVTVDLTQFNQDITNGALKWQESLVNTAIPTLQTFSSTINDLVVPSLQNLAMNISSSAGNALSAVGAGLGGMESGTDVVTSDSISVGGTDEKTLTLGGVSFQSALDTASISLQSFTSALNTSSLSLDRAAGATNDLGISLDEGEAATEENTKATTQSGQFAMPLMIASMLNATGVLGDFGQVLQMVLMIAQMGSSFGLFAKGGYVQGAGTGTSDSIPARLSNGEYVMKASAVKNLGVDFLDMLNNSNTNMPKRSARLPKFGYAEGGVVEGESVDDNVGTADTTDNVQSAPNIVMQMTFQSLDPEANMKMMEAQYPSIRQRLIRDLSGNSSLRTAVKGASI